MFKIKIFDFISSAHHLRDYKGKCETPHGHNWKIEIEFEGPECDRTGMLIDFKEAKTLLKKYIDRFDHKDLNTVAPFDLLNPTAENIAKFFFDSLKDDLKDRPVRISKVEVWESAGNCASYEDR